jgi:hypothetical protein
VHPDREHLALHVDRPGIRPDQRRRQQDILTSDLDRVLLDPWGALDGFPARGSIALPSGRPRIGTQRIGGLGPNQVKLGRLLARLRRIGTDTRVARRRGCAARPPHQELSDLLAPDTDVRAGVTYGAWLAGWTLGTTGMGIHHKVCHTLGGTYDLPHAPSHSAVLPYALAVNAHAAPAAMAAIEAAFRAAGREVDHAAGAVWDLRRDIGAPASLAALGFTAEQVDPAADIVVRGRPVNPRPVDPACASAVLAGALVGHRPARFLP